MCELCLLGLADPSSHDNTTPTSSGSNQIYASKPSFNYDQAAGQIAAYGWTNAATTPITYAFRASNAADPGFDRFSSAMIAASELALQLWADVANVTFERVGTGTSGAAAYSNDATMLFSADTDSGGYAWAYFPGSRSVTSLAGDVFLNTSNGWFSDVAPGSYDFSTILHEIGHALGLDHPGAYNGGSPTYFYDAEYAQDSGQYTVMSYFDAGETGADHGWTSASTPLLHDIAAVQLLYGANMTTRAGDTVYGFNSTEAGSVYHITSASKDVVLAVWDAGGTDTFDFSGYSDAQIVNLNQEAFSSVGGLTQNVAIARGVVIENAIGGSGCDTIIGNAAENRLEGRGGVDRLEGGEGNDWLDGGAGGDTLLGGAGDDTIVYDAADVFVDAGSGYDTLLVFDLLAPTAFSLGGHGFERAIVELNDVVDNFDWSAVVTYYNAAWARISELGTFDTGARWETTFDIDDVQTWSSTRTDFDAANRVTLVTVTGDAGEVTTNQLDVGNAAAWASIWTRKDASGALDVRSFTMDDGTTVSMDWDQAGTEAWSRMWTRTDASGVLDVRTFAMDNGTSVSMDWDQAGTEAWSRMWTRADASGVLDVRTFAMDNGTSVSTDWDQGDTFNWASSWTLRDPQGALDFQSVVYDDGRKVTTDWDATGSYDWSLVAREYDAFGALTKTTIHYDDGGVLVG